MLDGLQSPPLSLTLPKGYNALEHTLEFKSIIATITNVSLWSESDHLEHFNPDQLYISLP